MLLSKGQRPQGGVQRGTELYLLQLGNGIRSRIGHRLEGVLRLLGSPRKPTMPPVADPGESIPVADPVLKHPVKQGAPLASIMGGIAADKAYHGILDEIEGLIGVPRRHLRHVERTALHTREKLVQPVCLVQR